MREQHLLILVIIGALSCSQLLGQPAIPLNVPDDTPPEITEQIKKLYSSDPVTRSEAARTLGKHGKSAAAAIPFLDSMLSDDAGLATNFNPFQRVSSPGKTAGWALGAIGEAARPVIESSLEDDNPIVVKNAIVALD